MAMKRRRSTPSVPARGIPASDRRQRFIAEYLIDRNGTRAAIAAGYSAKTAGAAASRLLKEVNIRAAIDGVQREVNAALVDRYELTVEKTKRGLAQIGYSNMADYIAISDGAPVLDLSQLTWDQAAAISEVNVTTETFERPDGSTRTVTKSKIKLAPKREALVDIGKTLGMFKDGIDVTVPVRFVVERTSRSDKRQDSEGAS